ncbi:MAG: hypothetical protein KDA57_20840 [Planctomycetales bacterium]|nr:hypothetical protein [Planctomycetales bacterium]
MEARVRMLGPERGGRSEPCLFIGYRPHLSVQEGEMLGVEFTSVPPNPTPDVQLDVRFRLPYAVDYSSLAPGAEFKILEGARVVGFGTVVAT